MRGMRRSGGCDGGDKANKGEFWCGWIAGVRSAESDAASPGARGFLPNKRTCRKEKIIIINCGNSNQLLKESRR